MYIGKTKASLKTTHAKIRNSIRYRYLIKTTAICKSTISYTFNTFFNIDFVYIRTS